MYLTKCSRIFALLVVMLGLSACGGLFQGSTTPNLGVPYIAQEQFNYCVPASIAMWRAYDGLSSISQSQIFSAIGGAPCDGYDAAGGVRQFTNSGSDAYLDLEYPYHVDDFFARQITSINSAVPVMVIVSPFQDHVGIINGGAYQYVGSTGTYTWNTVLLHDPGAGPNLEFNSADWKAFTCDSNFSYCGQVISNSASYYWSSNLASFGSSVELYDGTGGCCNQEYQN